MLCRELREKFEVSVQGISILIQLGGFQIVVVINMLRYKYGYCVNYCKKGFKSNEIFRVNRSFISQISILSVDRN